MSIRDKMPSSALCIQDTMQYHSYPRRSVFAQTIRVFPICLILLSGCGSERTYSGIWREVNCEDDDPETKCRSELYELHLGRFGQKLTGVSVRYETQEGLDTFERSFACGCFFLRGGRADGSEISFGLFDEDAMCLQPNTESNRRQCPDCECQNRRFELEEVDGALIGRMSCDGGRSHKIRFEQTEGKPRRRCVDLSEE